MGGLRDLRTSSCAYSSQLGFRSCRAMRGSHVSARALIKGDLHTFSHCLVSPRGSRGHIYGHGAAKRFWRSLPVVSRSPLSHGQRPVRRRASARAPLPNPRFPQCARVLCGCHSSADIRAVAGLIIMVYDLLLTLDLEIKFFWASGPATTNFWVLRMLFFLVSEKSTPALVRHVDAFSEQILAHSHSAVQCSRCV